MVLNRAGSLKVTVTTESTRNAIVVFCTSLARCVRSAMVGKVSPATVYCNVIGDDNEQVKMKDHEAKQRDLKQHMAGGGRPV